MKNLIQKTIVAAFVFMAFISVNAQSNIPQFVNFQAVARDDNNNPIVLQPIQIELTIRQGGSTGTPVYGAVYEDSTNMFGEFRRLLGTTPTFTIPGIASDFTAVPWQNGNMWAVIRYKSSIVGTFKTIGAFQYVTVPYAFSSGTAEKLMMPGNSVGQVLTWNGNAWQAQAPAVQPNVPIGTIVAYAGDAQNPPSGWLLCDGTSYSINTYPLLYAAIQSAWGSSGAGFFNVPELRGMFLRGWSQSLTNTSGPSKANDPDWSSRYAKFNNGSTQNHVGSYQNDAFQNHTFNLRYTVGSSNTGDQTYLSTGTNNNTGFNQISKNSIGDITTSILNPEHGTPRFGPETRPVNAAVMYIIKYQ